MILGTFLIKTELRGQPLYISLKDFVTLHQNHKVHHFHHSIYDSEDIILVRSF